MGKHNRKLKTMDGNTAAAHVAYAFSEVAAIYPITPSSVMAENIDAWANDGRKNLFGQEVKVVEMQSEGGAAGAVHGSLITGSLTSTYTASQGLLLMIPNMYKIAAERLPGVFHVAARALTTQSLSIFGDHSDVMATRQTGFAMLASNSPQEVMDLAAVAHLSAIKASLPVLHFFDGFRTSHEQQKIEVWDYDTLERMLDKEAVAAFRKRAQNPNHPHLMGSAEQPETFFQHNESRNEAYKDAVSVIASVMEQVNEEAGTNYKPFNYYGAEDATEVIIAMGSVCETAEEVVDYLNASGRKVGLVKVHLYRPFSSEYLSKAIPESVQKIAVLDRTKEPGAQGEPLYLDVVSALNEVGRNGIEVCHGRYGLGSKDTQPGDVIAVYDNLDSDSPKREFTISITDDVTHLSLPRISNPVVSAPSTVSCKFWGLGADGTVGANKNSVKIIGDNTDKYVQAYFQYDSKKSGGVTISHLRFGDEPIRSTYYVNNADFIACHNASYMHKYRIVQDVNPGGTFLLNCSWSDAELDEMLPASAKRYIAENDIQLYTCDAVKIATELGLGARRTNTVLQAAFFRLSNIIPIDKAVEYMKDAIRKTYGRKGEDIVSMNCKAVDSGVTHIHKVEIPESWKDAEEVAVEHSVETNREDLKRYVKDVLIPSAAMEGDSVPVSKFTETCDGMIPSGTAAFEKRGVAISVPKWIPENCIQCNMCAFVCPHGAIRPFAITEEEQKASNAPAVAMKGKNGGSYQFTMTISTYDCAGCGSCVECCPSKNRALEMMSFESEESQDAQKVFDYLEKKVPEDRMETEVKSVKDVGYRKPLLEFSGACPGCGESPYAKLVTQLYGDRMIIANATGCSSIWGGSAPSTPYTVNSKGRGPAWSNSLFEDNAEFGLGMAISVQTRRNELRTKVEILAGNPEYQEAAKNWLDNMNDGIASDEAGQALLQAIETDDSKAATYVKANSDMLLKPSVWMFGGDGWAYDIGYGGLDHALASGENINVLVFDTEVYSNTGGQASKSTPTGAVAQFAAGGKRVGKKNLAQMAMSYGYVYVAQIAMGANPAQAIKAIKEAEAYDGPSIIIAYAPCINHGIRAGMNNSMPEMKKAVESGYWNLFRFNPSNIMEKKNPLTIDSKEPTEDYKSFLMGEVRYRSLQQANPERAEKLFDEASKYAKDRYDSLVRQRDSLEN